MIATHDLMPMEIRHPERPQPINFAFRRAIDWDDLSMCRDADDRALLFERLKRMGACELAEHIAKHCKWFDRSLPAYGEMVLQLELTIADRGAYENWIPRAQDEARREGWRSAMDAATRSLPYGLAESASDFYE